MSNPQESPKSMLIIGIMYNSGPEIIIQRIETIFGEKIMESPELEFSYTEFYRKEFGEGLKKRYLCFRAFDPGYLAEAKLKCYALENEYCKNNKRQYNIDPGYVTENSVVLASFKKRAHRVYLSHGVYADLQLVFENNMWNEFRWTFPDMKEENIRQFLKKIKEKI